MGEKEGGREEDGGEGGSKRKNAEALEEERERITGKVMALTTHTMVLTSTGIVVDIQ